MFASSITLRIDLSVATLHENRYFITGCLEPDQICFQGGGALLCCLGVNVSLLHRDQKQKAVGVLAEQLCQRVEDCLFHVWLFDSRKQWERCEYLLTSMIF